MENMEEKLKKLYAIHHRDLKQLIEARNEILLIEDAEEQERKKKLFVAIWVNFYEPRAAALYRFHVKYLKTISQSQDLFFGNIRDLLYFEERQAIKKLLKTWFPKKVIFYSRVDEFNSLLEPLYTRLRETRDSYDIPQEDWEQISAKDILLAFEKMDLGYFHPDKNPISRVESFKDEKNPLLTMN